MMPEQIHDEIEAMQCAPKDKRPIGAMPQAAKKKNDEDVETLPGQAFAVAS